MRLIAEHQEIHRKRLFDIRRVNQRVQLNRQQRSNGSIHTHASGDQSWNLSRLVDLGLDLYALHLDVQPKQAWGVVGTPHLERVHGIFF
jgi:hypothetical protein